VEVLEGSASLLFGRGSTGGIINQVSKRPQLKPVGEVNLSLGSDNYYRTTADIGHALSNDSAYRLEVMGQYVEATRNSVIKKKDYGVAPSISFGIGTPTQITLSLLSQHNNDVPDYGFPVLQLAGQSQARPLNVPWGNYYGFANNNYDQDVNVFGADVTHKFDGGLTLRSNTQYSQYHTDPAATPLSSLRFQADNGNWCTYNMASGNAAGCPVVATPAAGPPSLPDTPVDYSVVVTNNNAGFCAPSSYFFQPQVVNEAVIFNCTRCGKPLGTEKMIGNMLTRLAGHSMFAEPGSLDRLKMCADCRVIDKLQKDLGVSR